MYTFFPLWLLKPEKHSSLLRSAGLDRKVVLYSLPKFPGSSLGSASPARINLEDVFWQEGSFSLPLQEALPCGVTIMGASQVYSFLLRLQIAHPVA